MLKHLKFVFCLGHCYWNVYSKTSQTEQYLTSFSFIIYHRNETYSLKASSFLGTTITGAVTSLATSSSATSSFSHVSSFVSVTSLGVFVASSWYLARKFEGMSPVSPSLFCAVHQPSSLKIYKQAGKKMFLTTFGTN